MSKTQVITARVDADVAEGLERLGSYYERSRSWLVAKAVARYVEEESQFFAALKEGEDAIARGDFTTHEDLIAEIEALRQQKNTA
jgi:predicted transcriptional regulator